jgi:hypothetical protein
LHKINEDNKSMANGKQPGFLSEQNA